MIAAQGSFQTAFDECSNSYAQMDGQINGLHASWHGDAASIYQSAMVDWLDDFSKVNAALDRMLEQLSKNTGVYTDVHADTSDKAAQVAQTMANGGGLPNFPI
jgi:WXG100 family type VII secretion target